MSIPYDQRAYHIKAEVLELMAEGYVLKVGPFGGWLEHPDKEEWNHHAIHGNSFRALKKDGSIRRREDNIWVLV